MSEKQKRISEKLIQRMYGVFHMLDRMAVWAKHLQIFLTVVFSIQVTVMYAKNFWNGIIPTFRTGFNHSTPLHGSAKCVHTAQTCQRTLQFPLYLTVLAAKNAILRWRLAKILPTELAFNDYRPLQASCFPVAPSRTVFGSVRSKRIGSKGLFTHSTFANSFRRHQPGLLAAFGTKTRSVSAKLRNVVSRFTEQASFICSQFGSTAPDSIAPGIPSRTPFRAKKIEAITTSMRVKFGITDLAFLYFGMDKPRWGF